MRCNNCGWNNPETNSKCEKCGAVLSAPRQYQHASAPRNQADMSENLKKTVMDAEAFGQQVNSNACPKCGYPMREGTTV